MVPDGLENRATRKGKGVRFSHLPPVCRNRIVELRSTRNAVTKVRFLIPAPVCTSSSTVEFTPGTGETKVQFLRGAPVSHE